MTSCAFDHEYEKTHTVSSMLAPQRRQLREQQHQCEFHLNVVSNLYGFPFNLVAKWLQHFVHAQEQHKPDRRNRKADPVKLESIENALTYIRKYIHIRMYLGTYVRTYVHT